MKKTVHTIEKVARKQKDTKEIKKCVTAIIDCQQAVGKYKQKLRTNLNDNVFV